MARPRIIIPDDLDEYLEERKANSDQFNTKSDVICYLIGRGREAEQLEEELGMKLGDIKERLDQLQAEADKSDWERLMDRLFGG